MSGYTVANIPDYDDGSPFPVGRTDEDDCPLPFTPEGKKIYEWNKALVQMGTRVA